ncbi:MAG: hypothetical protein PHO83_07370, partial [Geobacteraceae bacterium]|nr:hypothetical protein [Geobacteraceae bacterium]
IHAENKKGGKKTVIQRRLPRAFLPCTDLPRSVLPRAVLSRSGMPCTSLTVDNSFRADRP